MLFKSAFIAAAFLLAQAQSTTPSVIIPAGTKIPLHLASTISSHDAKTGETFTFYVDQDVVVNGSVAVSKCAAGSGTVTLAGKHGINGHEGNLRLRFDTVTAADGSAVALTTDEQTFNGKNRKALSFFTTRWINGDDVEVKTDQTLTAVVAKDITLGATRDPAAACPTPAATSAPQ